MKRIQINISNKTFYTFVAIIILVVLAVVVYAQVTPNPGHPVSQIAPPSGCAAGEIVFLGSEGEWDCVAFKEFKQYVGSTSATYTGSGVGQISGGGNIGYGEGDAKCAAEFGAGARMCTGADFVLGRPNPVIPSWYSLFYADDEIDYLPVEMNDCSGWRSASSSFGGPVWDNGEPTYSACNVARAIACCR